MVIFGFDFADRYPGRQLNLSCVPVAYESAQNLHRADGAYVASK